MTKRSSECNQKNHKKIKLNDDIDAFWGEDFDADALDECINLATQAYQQEKITSSQVNDATLLPTYSAFKERNSILCSTQLTQFHSKISEPSTSKNNCISKKVASERDLENDLYTLRQQYKEKDGEISILRAQLRDTKSNIQNEQQKLHNEWKQKLTQAERQLKSVKSELEFKNLEIANLRQKVLEISKHNILDASLNQPQNISTTTIRTEKATDDINVKPKVLQPFLDTSYPLKDILPDNIFNISKREQHFTETRLTHTCKNTIPYLQNQSVLCNVVIDKSEFNLGRVYPDILKLVNCTEDELNCNESIHNKIICSCEQFMYDLQQFLQKIKDNMRTEDILEADARYLKNQGGFSDSKSGISNRDEIGVKASFLLNFLAHILPYSAYLQNYICRDKPLVFQDNDKIQEVFPYYGSKRQLTTCHYFLNATLDIITIAGEIRKSNYMSKFLNSTIKLLTNIYKSRNYDYVNNIFCKLTKEIILSRPPLDVICEITFLFKVVSQNPSFVEFLFNKSENVVSRKKGILYYNRDACQFYIFVILFDNSIFGSNNKKFPLSVCLNLICFMYNTFKTCHWIHHRDLKECECIPQLYKLEIEVVSRALEIYIEETKKEKRMSSDWAHFFKHPITTKVLNLMTFNSYELTEKYITVFSQYKQIEKTLQEEDELIELEKLHITEEIMEINSDAFKSANF